MGTDVSLHGIALGFDSQIGAFRRRGFPEFNDSEGLAAATTASNVKFRGTTTLGATAAKDYTMNAPPAVAGFALPARLTTISTSTAIRTVTLASGNFQSTTGSSFTKLSFNGIGQAVQLVALSTALVGLLSNTGATLST